VQAVPVKCRARRPGRFPPPPRRCEPNGCSPNGKKARIDGPDISADLGRQQLTHFMTDVVAKWADTHRSMLPKPV
jgi:hypothetical protein